MRSSSFVASLLALLALYAPSATLALPSGSPISHHVVRSTEGQLIAPLLGAVQDGRLPINAASGLTDRLPLAGLTSPRTTKKQKQQHQERATQPRTYKASARSVPLPLRRPRETESQLGERDDSLLDASGCGEAGMHDCFVGHENERTRERRAESASSGSGRLGGRRMPSPAATMPVDAAATPAGRAGEGRGDRMMQIRKR